MTDIGDMVDVAQQLHLLLVQLLILHVGLAYAEARQEGAGVGGGVDQAVDDIVAGGGHHCQLQVALGKEGKNKGGHAVWENYS